MYRYISLYFEQCLTLSAVSAMSRGGVAGVSPALGVAAYGKAIAA